MVQFRWSILPRPLVAKLQCSTGSEKAARIHTANTGLLPTIRVLVPFLWLAAGAMAQWINYPTPATPRTKDGKPNLAAPAPKTRDGKPDLSGIWESLPPAKDIASHRWPQGAAGNGFDTADESDFDLENYLLDGAKMTLTPAAEALFTQRIRGLGSGRPSGRCLPHGISDAMLIPADFKIVQNPRLTLILFEEFNHHYRQIFTDGRPHPVDPNPAWFGYSIGKWDRGTFVVDTVGFNDRSWLDDHGHPHTEALHTIERFRRRDFGHLEIQLTVDDPKARGLAHRKAFAGELPVSPPAAWCCLPRSVRSKG